MAVITGASATETNPGIRRMGSDELVDAAVEIIPTFSKREATVLMRITPAELLELGATYEVVVTDPEGYVRQVGVFSVTTEIDDQPPILPAVEGFAAEARAYPYGGSSCLDATDGYIGQLRFELAGAPQGGAYSVMTVRQDGAAPQTVAAAFVRDEPAIAISTGNCLSIPPVAPEETYCASVTVYDLAGHAVSTDERCARAVECALRLDDPGPPRECLPPTSVAPPIAPPGTGGCAIAAGAAKDRPRAPALLLLAAAAIAATRLLIPRG